MENAIIAILTLIILALCGVVASQHFKQRDETEVRILSDKMTYEAAQRGDLQKIQSVSGIVLLADVREYERMFGTPSGTNYWAIQFAKAKVLAKSIENSLVPASSILTNSSP